MNVNSRLNNFQKSYHSVNPAILRSTTLDNADKDHLATLNNQIQVLEKQQTQLEAQHVNLNQELAHLYQQLMTKFEQRWPPLQQDKQ